MNRSSVVTTPELFMGAPACITAASALVDNSHIHNSPSVSAHATRFPPQLSRDHAVASKSPAAASLPLLGVP